MKAPEKPSLKVVAHLRGGKLVKGYTDAVPVSDLEALMQEGTVALPRTITVRPAESRKTVTLALNSLKALFFVKTFEGHKEYKEIKFFDADPPIDGLWVRLTFLDKESTEGVVRNSLDVLVNRGFFLKPPDPHSNNEIVYVVKDSLAEFRVLGVRREY